MKYIYLNCSNLAKYTGHNKYDTLENNINFILKSNNIKSVYVPSSNIEETLSKLNIDELNKIKTEMKLDVSCDVKELEKKIVKELIYSSNSLDKNITEEESKNKIDNKIKNSSLKILDKSIKKDLRMKRGQKKENDNLNIIQNKTNINITDRNSKLYNKILYKSPDNVYAIIIRGKIDGIQENKIIESKNRTKRLFNKIPDYEKVQLESYMYLTDLNKSVHIEHYNDTHNITKYDQNIQFWDNCIKNIIQFIDTYIKSYINSDITQ